MNSTKSPSRLLFWAASHVALLTLALITLIPMIWMVCAALKTREDYFTSLFLPGGDGFLGVAWDRLTLANLFAVFSEANLARSVLNSFFYASVTSVVGTLCCAMGGFALSKYAFRGQGLLLGIVLAALIIPGPLLLAPGYQWIFQLGLLNTFTGLIVPGLASAFGVFLFRQSMIHTVPGELLEAADVQRDSLGTAVPMREDDMELPAGKLAHFLIVGNHHGQVGVSGEVDHLRELGSFIDNGIAHF